MYSVPNYWDLLIPLWDGHFGRWIPPVPAVLGKWKLQDVLLCEGKLPTVHCHGYTLFQSTFSGNHNWVPACHLVRTPRIMKCKFTFWTKRLWQTMVGLPAVKFYATLANEETLWVEIITGPIYDFWWQTSGSTGPIWPTISHNVTLGTPRNSMISRCSGMWIRSFLGGQKRQHSRLPSRSRSTRLTGMT